MKKLPLLYLGICLLAACTTVPQDDNTYVVLASNAVQQDASWNAVATHLQEKHQAQLIYFQQAPEEAKAQLQDLRPRYVAIVEKPENIYDDYVVKATALSRQIDDDIYADYLWGIITGYDAASARRMLDNSTEPFEIHNAVSDIMELNSAKWFDNYAWVDDHTKGLAGEKKGLTSPVETYTFDFDKELDVLSDFIYDYKPDLIVTATHANYDRLTVPFMPAEQSKYISDKGVIYKEYNLQRGEPLKFAGNRNVYFAVGNCLIGGVDKNPNSMVPAWINSANSATMIGYVVSTWYGRNGWGGLKYWITNPSRYTLAQAMYMNQQDMLAQMDRWDENFINVDFPFTFTPEEQQKMDESRKMMEEMRRNRRPGQPGARGQQPRNGQAPQGRPENGQAPQAAPRPVFVSANSLAMDRLKAATALEEVTMDMVGFLYDRDVVAYYGDPLWNVRMQPVEGETDFTVTQKQKGKVVTVTITTAENFSLERMEGGHFKEEHVLNLPFNYFFPARLNHPTVVPGQSWDAVVDENFLLIYDPKFEPNQTYTIQIAVE